MVCPLTRFACFSPQAAAVARAVADDNAKASAVFFSGTTCSFASYINGLFEPTEEKSSDGRVVYKKRENDNVIIEHYQGGQWGEGGIWQIKHISNKGKNIVFAEVRGGCALEACVDRVWGEKDLKMSTGAEAEAQASSLDARARQHTAPTPLPLV